MRASVVSLSLLVLLLCVCSIRADGDDVSGASEAAKPASDRGIADMTSTDIVGLVFMTLALVIASAGGMGGGSFLVPSLVLIMGFDIKRASPISSFAVLGCAVASNWFNLRKRHPIADRPLIDSNLTALIVPVVMGGAIIGAVLTNLLPSYLISLLFVVVLALTGGRTVQKAIKLHRRETAAQNALLPSDTISSGANSADVKATKSSSPNSFSNSNGSAVPADSPLQICLPRDDYRSADDDIINGVEGVNDRLETILASERHLSLKRHLSVVVCYLGLVIATVVGKLVECGGVVFWVVLLIEIPWVAGFTAFTSHTLYREHELKQEVGYPYVDGDVKWTGKLAVRFPLGCAAAGLIAGLFGIGGAIVGTPLMLELGIIPEVVASTSAILLFYSSAASLLKYIMFNMVTWDWAMLLFAIATTVTAFSQVVILGYVRRTGRQSLIVLCIGVSILLGAALMTYRAIELTVREADQPFSADVCR